MHVTFLIAATFTFGLISLSVAFDCKKQINTSTAAGPIVYGTFDLCDFVIGENSKDGWYEAYDSRSQGNVEGGDATNYTFYFNILSNIEKATPDTECDNWNRAYREEHGLEIGYCEEIKNSLLPNASCPNPEENIKPITQMVAAYQAKKGKDADDKCWRLHDGVSEPIWTFLNKDDPAMGIQIVYTNGDWCQGFGKNREFKLQFHCSNDVKLTPDYVQTVYEPIDSGCSYEFSMDTIKGCPLECVVDNDELCSGHGVCDYDWVKKAPKCFCYKGWYGPDCQDTSDPMVEVIYDDSDNSYVGALVIVILLLFVILFILGYLFLRYTKIKNQPFDFNFLQQTKKRKAKGQVDEYSDE